MRVRALLPRRVRRWVRARVVDCSLAPCRRFTFAHPWQRQKDGILLEGLWYCSPECLRDALDLLLRKHARPDDSLRRRTIRLPMRLVLFERGIVTSEQLEAAREGRAAQAPDEEFGDTLLRLGFATEAEVANARAVESGCPVYTGTAKLIPLSLQLPDALMRAYAAVPLCHVPLKGSAGRLFLGFGYHVHHGMVRAVEQVTGCEVEACVSTRSVYEEQLARLLRARVSESSQIAAPPLVKMREEILGQAILHHAETLSLARAGRLLWVRLAGGPHDADLLFDLTEATIEAQELEARNLGARQNLEARQTDARLSHLGTRGQTKVTAREMLSPVQGRVRVMS